MQLHGCRTSPPTLLDGHTRKRICDKLGLSYRILVKDFPDWETVRRWVIDNALGRRNLTEENKSYLIGLRYNAEKAEHSPGRPEKGDHCDPLNSEKTAERMGREHGIGSATVKRNGQYADAVDAIAELAGPEVKEAILAGATKLDRKATVAVGKLAEEAPEEARKVVAEAIDERKKPGTLPPPKPACSHSDRLVPGLKFVSDAPDAVRPLASGRGGTSSPCSNPNRVRGLSTQAGAERGIVRR